MIKKSMGIIAAIFMAVMMMCIVVQAHEEVPLIKNRFSHAELYYPKGKYNQLNDVSKATSYN